MMTSMDRPAYLGEWLLCRSRKRKVSADRMRREPGKTKRDKDREKHRERVRD